jgi:hypothetical protein
MRSSKRLAWLCLAIGLVWTAGCGSSADPDPGKTLAELLPASGEVTGWQENTDRGEPGPETTTDSTQATDWVNGAMDLFLQSGGWAGLGREFYTNGELRINLVIHEWTDSAAATKGYQDLATYHVDDIPDWTDVSLGSGEAACRMGKVGSFYWYVNAHKSKYLVETTTEPANDAAAETAAREFAAAVMAKLP